MNCQWSIAALLLWSAGSLHSPGYGQELLERSVEIHYHGEEAGLVMERMLENCAARDEVNLVRVGRGGVWGSRQPARPLAQTVPALPSTMMIYDPESADANELLWRERLANQGVRTVALAIERSLLSDSTRRSMLLQLHAELVELLPADREALDRNLERELRSSTYGPHLHLLRQVATSGSRD